MQLAELKSKTCGGKILRYLINRAIGFLFYNPPGSKQYKLLCL